MIFEKLSYEDLRKVVLVSRRWKEIGDTPRLWSSLPVIVKTDIRDTEQCKNAGTTEVDH